MHADVSLFFLSEVSYPITDHASQYLMTMYSGLGTRGVVTQTRIWKRAVGMCVLKREYLSLPTNRDNAYMNTKGDFAHYESPLGFEEQADACRIDIFTRVTCG